MNVKQATWLTIGILQFLGLYFLYYLIFNKIKWKQHTQYNMKV
jgi:hypothetical protein